MTEQQQPSGSQESSGGDRPEGEQEQILIVGPDGQPVGAIPASALAQASEGSDGSDDGDDQKQLTELVEQPAKVMRIGGMIKNLLEEVRSAPLDEASRNRLKEIHQRSIKELETGLAPELVEELERLSLPFTEEGTPSEAELRIAQAQLVGWLEGLFHGIQTAIYAQQMAARAQFEQIRRQLPMGGPGQPGQPGPGQGQPGLPGQGQQPGGQAGQGGQPGQGGQSQGHDTGGMYL
ncbi:bacterial proteasome activator family protein [Nocardioides rotundus]|uniref:bacterial proteasome activator family protein n=1 Tax=Nocardioides rotundus TaxID=1774216 RepID=UPI0021D9E27B|nr:bacterial proteasome activator family protein [Nocardioides rotundus]UAL29612.1 bacterial proteasome activator family protein [Nocardioides rotundus]